jgi:hypothetical protein
MVDLSRTHRWFAFGFVLAWALSHLAVARAQNEKEGPPTASEKIRKTLEQVIALDYQGQSIREAIAHIEDRSKLPIVLDPMALQAIGLPEGIQVQAEVKNLRGKLRQALQGFLHNYGLTYVVLEDSLLITTEDGAVTRQMRQRIPVEIQDVAAGKALRDLARKAGVSLVLDPRVAKTAQQKVTLELDDATVETSLRLVAEFVDLKAVRMGNVMFVTDATRAEKIRKEEASTPASDSRAAMLDRLAPFIGGFGGIGAPAIAVPAVQPVQVPAAPLPPPANDPPAKDSKKD